MTAGDLAIDLGTNSTRVVRRRNGVVFDEPTVAAIDITAGKLIAFGRRAAHMQGKAAGRISVVRPLDHGQIIDLDLAEAVIAHILRAVRTGPRQRPSVVACVPGGATGVQRRAVERSLRRGGARKVLLIDQQTACAIGARLPIHEAAGSMVVDMGAGTTEIGILALGAPAAMVSVPVGGADLDEAIRQHCRRELDLVVDRFTAEQVKIAIGSASGLEEEAKAEVRGRDLHSGRPRTAVLSRSELFDVMDVKLREVINRLVAAIRTAPPDLGNDLLTRGLHLAGGSARLTGLRDRLAAETGLPVHLVDSPEMCAITGAARCLTTMQAIGPALSGVRRK
jgi:rod shape-determining protein MreB